MAVTMARAAAALAMALLAAIIAWSYPALSAEMAIEPSAVRVIDGDTIRLNNTKPNVRLVGFNAPETRRARCEPERQKGAEATRRVRDLVAAGGLTFEPIACSCPPGTELTKWCNGGRSCGTLRAKGRDVGAILMAEGLAVALKCGPTSCPKMDRPWCSAGDPRPAFKRSRRAPT